MTLCSEIYNVSGIRSSQKHSYVLLWKVDELYMNVKEMGIKKDRKIHIENVNKPLRKSIKWKFLCKIHKIQRMH